MHTLTVWTQDGKERSVRVAANVDPELIRADPASHFHFPLPSPVIRFELQVSEVKPRSPVRISTYVEHNHSAKEIDWNNRSDRQWLQSHLHWAVHNNAQVSIRAV